MIVPPMFAPTWGIWARASVLVAARLKKPHGVRILLDDGTEIPCRCSLEGVLDSGEVVWSAIPAMGERVPGSRLNAVEVDDLPVGTVLHLSANMESWKCPSCGRVCYDPREALEVYCFACRRTGQR